MTSAIIGPRTMEQLDDVLAGADVRLDEAMLDAIDADRPARHRRRGRRPVAAARPEQGAATAHAVAEDR